MGGNACCVGGGEGPVTKLVWDWGGWMLKSGWGGGGGGGVAEQDGEEHGVLELNACRLGVAEEVEEYICICSGRGIYVYM